MKIYKVFFDKNVPKTAILLPDRKDVTGLHSWKYNDSEKTEKVYLWIIVEAKDENEALENAQKKIEKLEEGK